MSSLQKTPEGNQPDLNAVLSELETILDEAGPEIRQLFASALTIFAGVQSNARSADQKQSELEILITRTK